MTKRSLIDAGPADELKVFVGASKWREKTWTGKIYPPKTPDSNSCRSIVSNLMLLNLALLFTQLNAEQLNKWTEEVAGSPDFKFCPWFHQQVTHMRRLTNAGEPTARFYQSLTAFGNHLGPLLLQLGEKFSPKSLPQLKAYLASLPPSIPVAVEVRHKEWFSDEESRKALIETLHHLNIGTVISDTAGRRDAVHMELTTSEALIRFVGNNLAPTDYTRLDEWVERLQVWQRQGLKKLWFFMHQDNERYVPEAADYLIKRLNGKLGTAIAGPRF